MVNLYKPLDGKLNIPKQGDYLDIRKDGRIHNGIDYSASTGTNIYSSADGWVICSGITTGYGNTIVIEHRNGTSTLYGHMKDLSTFKIGDYVGVREKIGEVGNTGESRGSHLHFEHIDKEGTKQIKEWAGKEDKLGLIKGTHRLNPHNSLKEIGGKFIWHCESEETEPCDDCLARDRKIFIYGEDIEPPLHPNCDCWIEDYDGTNTDGNNFNEIDEEQENEESDEEWENSENNEEQENVENDEDDNQDEDDDMDKEKAREMIEELEKQLINLKEYLKDTESLYRIFGTQDLEDKINELRLSIDEMKEEIDDLNMFIDDEEDYESDDEYKNIRLQLEFKSAIKKLIKINLEEFYYSKKFVLYLRKGIL